jgi:hypothetical protein
MKDLHISPVQLLCVAFADNLHFTKEEAEHLIHCPDCYRQWKLYVDDFARDPQKPALEDT